MKLAYKYQTIAYIDINAFRNNINIIRKKNPGSMIILPVKANAYGHDDLIISKEAEKIGIEYLAIARISEGIKLRNNKIKMPIINLGAELGNNIEIAILNDIELTVHSQDNLKEIISRTKKYNKKINIHLKIDTGMRRLGCPLEEVEIMAEKIINSKNLYLKSILTHYADSGKDHKLTQLQTNLFVEKINNLKAKNIMADFYHLYNSGSIINPPQLTDSFKYAVRPGIMSYGYSPLSSNLNYDLKPVMTLKSEVIQIKHIPEKAGVSYGYTYKSKKPAVIATIPLGYGDGFPRSLSNKFKVTINNKNYNQIGTISMDLTVIEVDKDIKIGDTVLIFGNKNECINDANDLAKIAGTISYEITTMLNSRIERKIL
ncbi:MAG: alanine racemase [Spirochaetes bacterium]|nr:alanine racemase [Spirochaetota bacterium]